MKFGHSLRPNHVSCCVQTLETNKHPQSVFRNMSTVCWGAVKVSNVFGFPTFTR